MPEIARFVVAGCINTGATYAIYLLLIFFVNYSIAYTVAYVIGIGIAYLLSTSYVFKARRNKRSMALFPLVYACQYLIGLTVLTVSVKFFNVPQAFAAIIGIAVSLPVTFLLSRLIIQSVQTPNPR